MNYKSSQGKSRHQWVVLYWMPYDNDLSRFGEPIVEMLTRGTRGSEVAVVVQSDYWGEPKMRRRLLVNGAKYEIDVTGEDSSDVLAFSAYLDRAYRKFEAERWAVIVVGHGGKINEISPDEHNATGQMVTWMRLDRFTNAVSEFNQTTGGRVELLFFQNCNKATLEVAYEARNCAKYTLASQFALGAPNYYYEGFLNRLKEPSVGGREAALAIMDSERLDMYHTLTLVDNRAVKNIPEKLSRLLESILKNPLPGIEGSKLSTDYYFGEGHCDVLALLGYLSSESRDEFVEFAEFIRSSVIAHYQTGGELYSRRSQKDRDSEELCGLSLYLPESDRSIYRYSFLALYREVDLVGLYRRMLAGVGAGEV